MEYFVINVHYEDESAILDSCRLCVDMFTHRTYKVFIKQETSREKNAHQT